MKTGMLASLVLIGFLGLIFLLEMFGLGMIKFFGPKYEAVRREIFEESRAHVTGTNQHLGRLLRDYEEGSPGQKGSLKTLICMEYDTIAASNLNPRIRSDIESICNY